jgi:hypothetical protein
MNKQSLKIGLSTVILFANLGAFLPTSVQAQNQAVRLDQLSSQCRTAINQTINNIERGRRVNISNLDFYFNNDFFISAPTNSPYIVLFPMKGVATDSIMNSPVFLTNLSSQLLTQCNSLSAVGFGQDDTDWNYLFGRINNRVRQFQCTDQIRSDLNWGEWNC